MLELFFIKISYDDKTILMQEKGLSAYLFSLNL